MSSVLNGTKGRGRRNVPFPACSPELEQKFPALDASGSYDLDVGRIAPPTFLDLHLADDTMELLNLHNCMSQSLIINPFLSMYLIGSLSLMNPNT